MNEKVDVNAIIELKKNADSDEEGSTSKNEEEQKYHESVINDVYDSMSDSDSEEENDKQLQEQINEETKQKGQEIKKAKQSLGERVAETVKERVGKVVEEIKVDKVKGMFSGAFNKVKQYAHKHSE